MTRPRAKKRKRIVEVPEIFRQAVGAFKKALGGLWAQIPMGGAEWANKHFYLVPESSGTEGRWQCYPYQVALLNWMTSDDIEEVNLQKSRRVGYTKCILAAIGCLIEQKKRNVVVWQPTDGDAKDFVSDEVDPMLRDVPVLGRLLKCEVGQKSKFNTIDKKSFFGATWDIKGGKSARNYRRMTKDVAVYDETDAFDVDIDGEGACFELGDGRLDQAPFPKSIRGSTPKTKGLSLIEAAVDSADMVFYRYVKCVHCGELQRLEFSRLVWDAGDPDSVVYGCLNGCVLLYRDYAKMDAAGRWQTIDGYYYDEEHDRFHDPDGQVIPKPRRIGLRIWAAYSYLRPWSYVVDRWLVANKKAASGDITSLKTVVNTLLGETFEERGEKVDAHYLTNRVEDYINDGRIPEDVLVVTAGVDVQGGLNSRIEAEFVGWGLEYESWSLDYVMIPGDPEKPDIWQRLEEEITRRFQRDDGVVLPVSCTFVDSGYLASEVYRFTAPRRRRNVFATKGVTQGLLCNPGTWQGDKKQHTRAILRTVNVNDMKTIVFNRLRINSPGAGYCHFPGWYGEEYFVGLTNEEKVEKRRRGVLMGYDWVKRGPNEPLDCRVYASAGLEYLNPNMPKMKLRLEQRRGQGTGGRGEGTGDRGQGAGERAQVIQPPKVAKPRRRGFVTGY